VLKWCRMRRLGRVSRTDKVVSCVKKMHSIELKIARFLVEFSFALSKHVFFPFKL
jgi:hypothetical protein